MKAAYFLLFSSFVLSGKAQNLIPDSSFESNKAIPTDFSGIGNSYTWSRPGMGTTDLFAVYDRKKKKYSMVGVPQNAMGFQFAHSGTCYAGFFLFSHGDYREYLQTPLLQPLEKGKTYFLSFYLSLANFSQTYIDQLGFTFLPQEQHYETADNLTELAPTYIKLDKLKGDTAKWHHITGKYKATGEEKYLLIGSFTITKIKKTRFSFPKNIKTPINKRSQRDAYYYIDDVSLVEWINPPNEEIIVKKDTSPPEIKTCKNVNFETNSAELIASSYAELDELAVTLLGWPQQKICILGHTDGAGNKVKNAKLSLERAVAVMWYLVKKGVEKQRLCVEGYGDAKPLFPNDSEEHKAANRRVEIVFLK